MLGPTSANGGQPGLRRITVHRGCIGSIAPVEACGLAIQAGPGQAAQLQLDIQVPAANASHDRGSWQVGAGHCHSA